MFTSEYRELAVVSGQQVGGEERQQPDRAQFCSGLGSALTQLGKHMASRWCDGSRA